MKAVFQLSSLTDARSVAHPHTPIVVVVGVHAGVPGVARPRPQLHQACARLQHVALLLGARCYGNYVTMIVVRDCSRFFPAAVARRRAMG